MKINNELINKIFNNNPKKIIKVTNKSDKIKLSQYEDLIPMYDIYSEKIYPINKENIYYRLNDYHYRFITHEIKQWIQNQYNKHKDKKFQYNLDIIDNYEIDILLETSYKVLYKYSPELGLQVSICKRNSFNKYSHHLNPYYTKDELVKLGLNMDIIKSNQNINLNDPDIHYKICKKISKNDISNEEIIKHNNYIIDNNLISSICNYSFMGSYYMNRLLRGQDKQPNNFTINMINQLNNKMLNTPKLNNDYYLYRFIWDDDFLKQIKIGEKFIDKGFISTTRDPFYSPGLKSSFGLILVKIKIAINKNIGLLVENFSLFPKEEEFLLPPNSELLLLSKNDKFKYYHTNKTFENLIKTKYEFEYLGNKKNILNELTYYSEFKQFNEINIDETSIINIIKKFINDFEDSNNIINLEKSGKKFSIHYHFFDATESYSKFYYNKIKNGLFFSIYDENNYPYLNIEFGDEMVVNYLNTMFFYDKKTQLEDKDMELILNLAYTFKYENIKMYLEYNNFSKVSNVKELDKCYLYNNLYCHSLYEYLSKNIKFYPMLKNFHSFFKFDFAYWKLNKFKSDKLSKEIIARFKDLYNKNTTISDLIIDIIENHFYYYQKLESIFKQYNIENIFDKLYLNIDVISYYNSKNINIKKSNITYENDVTNNDENYKLIFRQPIRRIN
jgi:hypothetical protein